MIGHTLWGTLRPAPPGPPCTAADDDPCAPLRLADGRRLSVQALRAGDAAAEQDFIKRLSRQSRYRRFHVGIPELPPSLLARLVEVDQVQHVALAARPLGRARIVADARYVRVAGDGPDDAAAEFALTVADDWQGLGLGRELLGRLARHARSQGVRQLLGDVLHDNRPMLALVERLGGTLRSRPDDPGVWLARLPLDGLSA